MSVVFPPAQPVDYTILAEETLKQADVTFKATQTFWRQVHDDSYPLAQEEIMKCVNEACLTTLRALRYMRKSLNDQEKGSKAEEILKSLKQFQENTISPFRRIIIQFGGNNVGQIPAPSFLGKEATMSALPFAFQETEETMQLMIQKAEEMVISLQAAATKVDPDPLSISDYLPLLIQELPIELWEECLQNTSFKELIPMAAVCKEWKKLILETILPRRFAQWCEKISQIAEDSQFFQTLGLPQGRLKEINSVKELISSSEWLKQHSPFTSFSEVKEVMMAIQKVVATVVEHAASIEKGLFFFTESGIDPSLFREALGQKITNRINASGRLQIIPKVAKCANPLLLDIIAGAIEKTKISSMMVDMQNLTISDGMIEKFPDCFFSGKIQTLNFSRNQIGDKGLLHLCKQLTTLKKCTSLNLSENLVTMEGVEAAVNEMEGHLISPARTIRLAQNLIKEESDVSKMNSTTTAVKFIY